MVKFFCLLEREGMTVLGWAKKKKVHDLLGLFTVRKENSGAGNSGKEEKQKK